MSVGPGSKPRVVTNGRYVGLACGREVRHLDCNYGMRLAIGILRMDGTSMQKMEGVSENGVEMVSKKRQPRTPKICTYWKVNAAAQGDFWKDCIASYCN